MHVDSEQQRLSERQRWGGRARPENRPIGVMLGQGPQRLFDRRLVFHSTIPRVTSCDRPSVMIQSIPPAPGEDESDDAQRVELTDALRLPIRAAGT
jgi:hypothetical protein